jgi:protein tyrosine phosphatase (PTP) superfamily phosphohydrolase (DUF442 family)
MKLLSMLLRQTTKGMRILWNRLTQQGLRVTAMWAADHAVRIITGAPIRSMSQITPQLHVGGQYRRRGWHRLASRGITAVVNLRMEFDDSDADIAPEHYLYLPAADDTPPTLDQLHAGVAFIAEEIAQGGGVYVHCGAGVGRAATMAAAYLVSTGLTPDQAWARIQDVRPFIRPKPVQVAQVEHFAAQVRPLPGPPPQGEGEEGKTKTAPSVPKPLPHGGRERRFLGAVFTTTNAPPPRGEGEEQ